MTWQFQCKQIQQVLDEILTGNWLRLAAPTRLATPKVLAKKSKPKPEDSVDDIDGEDAEDAEPAIAEGSTMSEFVSFEGEGSTASATIDTTSFAEGGAAEGVPGEEGGVAVPPIGRRVALSNTGILPLQDRPVWRTHGMVDKLLGRPRKLHSSVTGTLLCTVLCTLLCTVLCTVVCSEYIQLYMLHAHAEVPPTPTATPSLKIKGESSAAWARSLSGFTPRPTRRWPAGCEKKSSTLAGWKRGALRTPSSCVRAFEG